MPDVKVTALGDRPILSFRVPPERVKFVDRLLPALKLVVPPLAVTVPAPVKLVPLILVVVPENIDKDAVAVFRDEMRKMNIELVDNDVLVYCTAVATADAGIESLRGLVAAIMGQNSPSPAKVEEHLESTFPGDGKG